MVKHSEPWGFGVSHNYGHRHNSETDDYVKWFDRNKQHRRDLRDGKIKPKSEYDKNYLIFERARAASGWEPNPGQLKYIKQASAKVKYRRYFGKDASDAIAAAKRVESYWPKDVGEKWIKYLETPLPARDAQYSE